MSHDLRRWLADRLPDGISTGERLVALEIADWAWDSTRLAYGKDLLDTVARRSGLANAKQVGKVLGKLSAHGVELRVPVKTKDGAVVTDSVGRPLYACKGHELTFRIPLAKECPALKVPQKGDLQRSPAWETIEAEGPPLGAQSSPERGTKVSPAGDPTPQDFLKNSSSLSSDAPTPGALEPPVADERETEAAPEKTTTAQRTVRASGVVAVADEDAFIAWVRAKYPPAGATFWGRVAENDDVPGLAVAWRADQPMRQSAPTAPAAPTCWTCNRPAPKPVVAFGRTYCSSCCEPCSGCRAATPADLLDMDTNRCSACRAPFAVA